MSSGMAAITTTLLGFLKSGDHIIVAVGTYGGTSEFLTEIIPKYGIEVTFVDSTDVSNYEKAIKSSTRLLYGESPANPTSKLILIQT
jgi:cystathionine beta-lyase/cystathionine gamma-synthase